MSEEILRALMQLFAIIAKQEEGVDAAGIDYVKKFLTQQLNEEKVSEYYTLFERYADIMPAGGQQKDTEHTKRRLTSVKDSVRILGLCKKINRTLSQKQKVIVLLRLLELMNVERRFAGQQMAIINTVAEVFNIDKTEFQSIRNFVMEKDASAFDDPSVLIVNGKMEAPGQCKHISDENLDQDIIILHIPSVDLYFAKFTGSADIFLNGMSVYNQRIYLFASGSAIRLPKGKPVYYSDVVTRFLPVVAGKHIFFEASHIQFQFSSGDIGLHDVSFAETQGRLIGIMGASGAGKTTLLHVLSGTVKPTKGQVTINGLDLFNDKDKLNGVIGLVPQDDLLIEELTVFQNLYFSAKQCFRNLSDKEITELINKTLTNLDLWEQRDLKVGSPLNKMISGGQRKRLNIALELIREPSILFVDEPTSGLSSRDSENVMDLLRELALKGKLVFVVIHQPSSEIFKMFDRIIILDTGGYMVYYGNPVEAVIYFKQRDNQINSEIGECPVCGTVNPELIFTILESKVVDEYGKYTDTRKVSSRHWEELYRQNVHWEKPPVINDAPPKSLNIPSWFRQFLLYSWRDFLTKISNSQYVILNLLEAPVLAFILSYIIRYIADPNSHIYIFRENENIPIYIFMALIVALFLGLTVSAEEIFHDRKILRRERFLNLSRSSYLASKIFILFLISAFQALVFVLIGNSILAIKDMTFAYWFALFSTAACANMMGLIISASFNSVVTIYIIIPLLIIPMMVLSGAMFPFDKLNRRVGSVDKVPLVADLMPTKWSYEALMVHQYKNNQYQRYFYDLEKKISQADYMQVYYIPELLRRLDQCREELGDQKHTAAFTDNLKLLSNELQDQLALTPQVQFRGKTSFSPSDVTAGQIDACEEYLGSLQKYYNEDFLKANQMKENLINVLLNRNRALYYKLYDSYFNESVSDQVRKVFEKNKILEYQHRLVQQYDPVYRDPRANSFLEFRSHFFAPEKYFAGTFFDTFWFNMSFIWAYTALLYLILYFNLLVRLMNFFARLKIFSKQN